MLTRATRDHYAILGVPKDADRDSIKKAFRALAAAYHPDVSAEPDADQRFREILAAYEVLSSAEARARYDRRGFGRAPSPPRRPRSEPAPAEPDPLDDLFDLVVPAPAPGERGGDLLIGVELAPRDARRGTTRGVRFTTWASCEACAGAGAAAGSRWRACPRCTGSGRVRESGKAPSGRLIRLRACGGCRGLGRLVDDPCEACAGRGRLEVERAVLVRFDARTKDGAEVRLGGLGHAGGRGAPAGDVVVRVSVRSG